MLLKKSWYIHILDIYTQLHADICPDHASAQDILQQGLMKILKYINQFDSKKGNLKGWMNKIIINEAIRNQKKYATNNIGIDEIIHTPIFESKALESLNAEDMISLIKTLPQQYKLVFNLNVIDGFSHSEIAEKLDITTSTSRSNLTRAKNMLKKLIHDQENKKQWQRII